MEGSHSENPQAFIHKPYRLKDLESAIGSILKSSL
jgi:hypothetical protein